MVEVVHANGDLKREYACTKERLKELCMANIECLLTIALIDSDQHIKETGGENELINLMHRYVELINIIEYMEVENEKNNMRQV